MSAGFHMLLKPMGSKCNMDCQYCFYSEKASLYPQENQWRITPDMLERFIRTYLQDHPGPEVHFLWQGGEPMLLGLEFYQDAVRLQRKYAGGKIVHNAIQTNGTLLNEQWCRFFRHNGFLVGLSLDGPEPVHDRYRLLRSGKPSFQRVMDGVDLLQRHGVEFNITACVTRESAHVPLEIYHFFKEIGARYLQFAPIVERVADNEESARGLNHAHPDRSAGDPVMFSGSVDPMEYGRFLCAIFDEWVRKDIGDLYVMNFEWALERWLDLPATYCIFGTQCGTALAVEHNGDVYACDHFVYPDYLLGNLTEQRPAQLVARSLCGPLSQRKSDLTQACMDCDVRFACQGECPKNRFLPTADGKGLNYLCKGYQYYFHHIAPYMEQIRGLLRAGRPAWEIRTQLSP